MTAYQGRFRGRTAIITGGASGLGRAVAKRIGLEGGRVCLWDLNPAALAEACAEIGGADGIALDVSDHAAVERATLEAREHLGGRIDILV